MYAKRSEITEEGRSFVPQSLPVFKIAIDRQFHVLNLSDTQHGTIEFAKTENGSVRENYILTEQRIAISLFRHLYTLAAFCKERME